MKMKTSDKFARYVSNILSPFIVAPIFIMWVSIYSMNSIIEGIFMGILVSVILIGPTLIYIVVQMKRDIIKDIHIKNREQRKPIYLIGLLSVFTTLLILHLMDITTTIYLSIISVLFVTIVCYIINKINKVSIHTSTLAGITVIFFMLSKNVLSLIVFTLTLILCWSRVRVKAHTIQQVMLGVVVGSLTTFVVFKIFGY